MYNVVLEMGADVFVILAEMEELIVSECILTSIEKSDNELIMNVRERIQEQVHDVEKQPEQVHVEKQRATQIWSQQKKSLHF